MKCPSCSAVLEENAADCLGCGVNIEKWRAKKMEPAPSAPCPPAGPPSSGGLGLWTCLGIAGALFAGYGLYAKSRRSPEDGAAQTASASAASAVSPTPAASEGSALSLDGYNSLWQEYSGRLQAMNAPLYEAEAKRFFQSGVEEIEGMNFDAMESVDIMTMDTPFTEEEKKLNKSTRCMGPSGMTYDAPLPVDDSSGVQCWTRKSGRAKSSGSVQVYYSDIFPFAIWSPLIWNSRRKIWSPWSDDQYLEGARRYIDKRYGLAFLAEESSKAEAKLAAMSGKDSSNAVSTLFEGYRGRFRREGALAALERLRK